ncbi:MAG TPA: proline racemase family protein [Vicinamibacterales bacterium]|nr:proline racemase family protein [Vicinamibacterales bacterium]
MEKSPVPLILRTIDAHTAGEPLRLVVEGWPAPKGRTMLERRAWAKTRQDRLRRALMFEPRGHADMYGALLTEPERPDSDAGVLFLHNEGFSTMCGHGIIAVATIVFERQLITTRASGQDAGSRSLTLDAPAGQIRARARVSPRAHGLRVDDVSFINVPSFVLAASVPVECAGRRLNVDVAFGGAFYAIVDAEAVGLAVTPERLPALREAGMTIARAVERAITVVHPAEPGLTGVYGTIFTGPPSAAGADLKNVTIFADREVDRSPCGTGTCAVLAVLDAMGLVDPTRPFVHESIIGTTFSARIASRAAVGDLPAIVPELTGSAWITGDQTFIVQADDPLADGFRI